MSESAPLICHIDNTQHLALLVGNDDKHLRHIEERLNIRLRRRGNHIAISGTYEEQRYIQALLRHLLAHLKEDVQENVPVMTTLIDDYLRLYPSLKTVEGQKGKRHLTIKVADKIVKPRSQNQEHYIKLLQEKLLVFSVGPAGTGKTWLAVTQAVHMLLAGAIDKIILSRPAVEAGEQLGFLPGDLKEKIDPYLQPLYDALLSMLSKEDIERRMANGEIEIAPLAFMRGRTLSHAFVILDEAQNTTISQMKMFLTRFGQGSHMVITGDLTQIDLPQAAPCGLRDAMQTLRHIPSIGMMEFTSADVVRHPLVASIIEAYEKRERQTTPPSH